MRSAKRQGVIDGFEEYEREPGSVMTWEINDDDSFLVIFENRNVFKIQYDRTTEDEARRLGKFLEGNPFR